MTRYDVGGAPNRAPPTSIFRASGGTTSAIIGGMTIILSIPGVTKTVGDVLKVGYRVFVIDTSEEITLITAYIDPGGGERLMVDKASYYKVKKECPQILEAVKLWCVAVIEMNVQEFVERMLGDEFRDYARLQGKRPSGTGTTGTLVRAWRHWFSGSNRD